MGIVRFLLAVVLVWYLVKLAARWVAGTAGGEPRGRGRSREEEYSALTDQKIEDAEFEDIEKE